MFVSLLAVNEKEEGVVALHSVGLYKTTVGWSQYRDVTSSQMGERFPQRR